MTTETPEQIFDKLRTNCWDKTIHSLGFNYIFNIRINKYSRYNKTLKFYALVFPALVGLIAFGYKAEYPKVLDITILIAVPLTIIQFVFSILAITKEWDNELLYSIEASQNYNNLSDKFQKLAENPPTTSENLRQQYELIDAVYNARTQQDSKHEIKEKELRKGMKYALRNFKVECYGCKKIPIDMNSTDCAVCGKFNFFD